MNLEERLFPEIAFGGFSSVDGTVAFYNRVNALISPESSVLDVGCGRGCYKEDASTYRRELRILGNRARRVVGVDVDPAARANPYLDEFLLIDDDRLPIEDASIDLVLCDWVVEHIVDPRRFFAELVRILRPGGYVCIRTPNRLGYVAMAARIVPPGLHSAVLHRMQPGRKEEDVFPTYYRINTTRKLRSLLSTHGFAHVVKTHVSEPTYFRSSNLAYGLGFCINAAIPPPFRPIIHAFGKLR